MTERDTMPKVRTTMEPDHEIEVTEQEALDLKRQGLIHEGSPEAEAEVTGNYGPGQPRARAIKPKTEN
jgi:hypothetical protein